MPIDAVYGRAPVLFQHLLATAHGARERGRRQRGAYERYVRELEQQEWWSSDALRDLQAARLRSMVSTAARFVPHYRELFSSAGLTAADITEPGDLQRLPILDKEQVRAEPDRFVNPAAGPLLAQTTGGTTGTPLRYWATPDAVQFNYATYEARMWRWAGVRFGARLASFNGKPIVPAQQTGPPFWRHNLAFNQLYFSVYHMSDENLVAYVRRLERFQPTVIVGYVSAVHRLARFLLDRGDESRLRPAAVLVSSETLFPWIRSDLEAAFGCRAWNGYSLGELVAWATECEHGTMHVSPEYGVVELVPGPDGPEIVATGLINHGMPLIRYRTGDLVDEGDPPEPCPCGRLLPAIPTILGRVDDGIVNPEGAHVGPAPLSLAFQTVPHLKAAQIHQEETASIRVLLEWGEGAEASDRDHLLRELRLRLGPQLGIELEDVDAIPKTVSGKQRLVVSSLPDSGGKGQGT